MKHQTHLVVNSEARWKQSRFAEMVNAGHHQAVLVPAKSSFGQCGHTTHGTPAPIAGVFCPTHFGGELKHGMTPDSTPPRTDRGESLGTGSFFGSGICDKYLICRKIYPPPRLTTGRSQFDPSWKSPWLAPRAPNRHSLSHRVDLPGLSSESHTTKSLRTINRFRASCAKGPSISARHTGFCLPRRNTLISSSPK